MKNGGLICDVLGIFMLDHATKYHSNLKSVVGSLPYYTCKFFSGTGFRLDSTRVL